MPPTVEEVRDRATFFFQTETQSFITPEDEELKEGGYWLRAQADLMRGDTSEELAYIEEMAHNVGRRLVTEADHDKLIDLERRLARCKTREEQIKTATEHLEAMKGELNSRGVTPAQTVTFNHIVKEIHWRTRKRRKKKLLEKALKIERKAGPLSLPDLEGLAALIALDPLPEALKGLEDLQPLEGF